MKHVLYTGHNHTAVSEHPLEEFRLFFKALACVRSVTSRRSLSQANLHLNYQWVTDSNAQPKFVQQATVSQASSAARFAGTHLLTPVLPELDPSHHLLVDEVGGHVVF